MLESRSLICAPRPGTGQIIDPWLPLPASAKAPLFSYAVRVSMLASSFFLDSGGRLQTGALIFLFSSAAWRFNNHPLSPRHPNTGH